MATPRQHDRRRAAEQPEAPGDVGELWMDEEGRAAVDDSVDAGGLGVGACEQADVVGDDAEERRGEVFPRGRFGKYLRPAGELAEGRR